MSRADIDSANSVNPMNPASDASTGRAFTGGATPSDPSNKRWAALAVLMLPVLLVSVDNTVLSFALPSIAADLHPTGVQQLWMIDVYALILAALLVPMGVMADRFGRRFFLLMGGLGFTAASVFGAFAPNAESLIGARAGMAIFGAMLMPSTMSLIRSMFDDAKERRLAIAIWAAAFGAGGALGPIVGGFLLEHFWWGSVFLIAVPMLIPLLVFGPVLLPESKNPNAGRIDLPSILMILAGMGGLTYAVKSVAAGSDLSKIVLTAVVGIVGLTLFIRRQKALENPMLDLSLFSNGRFSGAVMVNVMSVLSMVGLLFFITQELLVVHNMAPMHAGLLLLPGAVLLMASGLLAVPALNRFAPVTVIMFGLAASAIGYLVAANSAGLLIPMLAAWLLLAIGVGSAETVSNDLIIASAPPERAGAASAVSETGYEVGAVLGTAVLGGILTGFYRSRVEVPDAVTNAADRAAATETLGGAADVAAQFGADSSVAQQLMHSAEEAFASGIVWTAGIGAVLMGISIVVAWKVIGKD